MNSNNTEQDPTPVLTAIGDLDSPLWGDERDRTIHLEGAAVALEVQTFIGLTVGAALPWFLGKTGVGWGLAIVFGIAAANLCYARYISARGVKVHWVFEPGARTRGAIRLAIFGVGIVGYVRAAGGGAPLSFDGDLSTVLGVVTGIAVSLGIAVAFVRFFPRRGQTDVPDDVFTET